MVCAYVRVIWAFVCVSVVVCRLCSSGFKIVVCWGVWRTLFFGGGGRGSI